MGRPQEEIATANDLSNKIIGDAIEVHRHLGPGLLESADETCLCQEFVVRGIPFERQFPWPSTIRAAGSIVPVVWT
jgi:GxxExxY protein